MLQPQFLSMLVMVAVCSSSRIYALRGALTRTLGCNQVNTTFCSIWLIWHLKSPRFTPRIRKYSIYT